MASVMNFIMSSGPFSTIFFVISYAFESSCITPLLPNPSPAEDDELELALLTVTPLMLGVLLEVEFDVATRLLYELSDITASYGNVSITKTITVTTQSILNVKIASVNEADDVMVFDTH